MRTSTLHPALFLAIFCAPAAAAQEQDFRIAVNVNLVVLHATVRNDKGQFVSDLSERDFAVYEDGVRQTIRLFRHEDVPVTVGLVIDHSGSMAAKLADVTAAARAFVRASNPEDQMFVVNFNEHVSLGLPPAIRFTGRVDELESAISRAPAAGETALYDAIAEALTRIKLGDREKKALIVISDGADNASVRSLADVLQMAGESSSVIYTVGIFDENGSDANPEVLRRLARATGGEAFFPSQLEGAVAICERIARDIRNQYTLGYVPIETARRKPYRAIRVTASAAGKGKLVARTRTGYIAASDSGSAKKEDGK
jgi:VWFA-related protein